MTIADSRFRSTAQLTSSDTIAFPPGDRFSNLEFELHSRSSHSVCPSGAGRGWWATWRTEG